MSIKFIIEVELVPGGLLVRICLAEEPSSVWELVLDLGESFLHLFTITVNCSLQRATFWSLINYLPESIKANFFVVNLENYGLLTWCVEFFRAFFFIFLILDNRFIKFILCWFFRVQVIFFLSISTKPCLTLFILLSFWSAAILSASCFILWFFRFSVSQYELLFKFLHLFEVCSATLLEKWVSIVLLRTIAVMHFFIHVYVWLWYFVLCVI